MYYKLMSWLNDHQRIWRTVGLLLLLIALCGPLAFDKIHVPSPYECSLPNVRLDEYYCGIPISIAGYFSMIIHDLLSMVSRLISGATRLVETRYYCYCSY
jgi:hypothetical protein